MVDLFNIAVSDQPTREDTGWRYQPLVPVAVALAVGVALDCPWPIPTTWWLAVPALCLAAWASMLAWTRRHRQLLGIEFDPWINSGLVLAMVAGVGGAWHHVYWNVYPADDIGHWARKEARPARVRGVLSEEPLVVRARHDDPFRGRPDRTRSLGAMLVREIQATGGWAPASGRLRIVLEGEWTGFHAGDPVQVIGELLAPAPSANPGEFDYQAYLRGRRTRALLRCDNPQGVQPDPELGARILVHPFERLAGSAERLLVSRLPSGQAEIAVALLLGRYELLEEEVTELFLRTGTIHILAISGQHLGILAGFLWLVLRVLPVPRKCGALAIAVLVTAYALVTGARPPVLRATVLVCVLVGAIVCDCRSRRANPLALALILVLAVNPTDLFDRGLQLSFLSVTALFWMVRPTWLWLQPPADPISQLIAVARPAWQRGCLAIGRIALFSCVLSGVVWLANVPLLAHRFHLFSPIVVPLTVVLAPVVTVALIAGLGLLLVDPWAPGIGELLARACGGAVGVMEWCVRVGAEFPGGHWYVAGPPGWWVAGFYALLAGALLVPGQGVTRWRWATAGMAWIALGFAVPALRPAPGDLECRVLAVGNGSAAVIRLPDGRAVLIDAGQIGGTRVGSRLIAPALWSAGITRFAAVFVSHADVDHFNGLPHLIERFPMGTVFLPAHFAHSNHEAVRTTCDLMARRGTTLRVCWADDEIVLADGVIARVLHPPAEFGGTDNEQSLVLEIRYHGTILLLTGDLEGAGLRRLLSTAATDVDVLLAPHHGSRKANPPELVGWSKPELVLVSQGKPRSGATLEAYHQAGIPVLTTNQHGCITLRVDAQGIRLRTFRGMWRRLETHAH